MTIDVQVIDIQLGLVGHAYLCPISRAAVRCIPGAYNVATTREGIRVFYGSKLGYKFFPFNEVVTEYVRDFDVDGVMKPFQWEI